MRKSYNKYTFDLEEVDDFYLKEILGAAFKYDSVATIHKSNVGSKTFFYEWVSNTIDGLRVRIDHYGPRVRYSHNVNGTQLWFSWHDFYRTESNDPTHTKFPLESDFSLTYGIDATIAGMRILEHLTYYLTEVGDQGFAPKGSYGPNSLIVEIDPDNSFEFGVSLKPEGDRLTHIISCYGSDTNVKKGREVISDAFGKNFPASH